MLDRLLTTAAANAKLAIAAAAGAALVAGSGAVAVTDVAGSQPSDTPRASASGVEHRSDTATAAIALPKSDSAGIRPDNHGTCVSQAVANAKAGLAAGAKQGPAVSAAAKSCPKPGKGAATSTQSKKASEAARTAAEAKKKAGQSHRPGEAGRPGDRGPNANAADRSGGRARP